jgi:membrane protein YdbS with pleckstrin-like domain
MEEKAKPILMAIKPKHIPKKFLASDESVVFESHQSWWYSMKSATLGLLVVLAANIILDWGWIPSTPDLPFASAALSGINGGIQGLFALIALIALIVSTWVFFMRSMSRRRTVYAATDERLIKRTGLVIKGYEDIPLTQIENIYIKQSLGNKILGYGTITFSTKGLGEAGGPDMKWVAVPRPMRVRRILQEVMDIRDKPKRHTKKELAAVEKL